MSPAERLVIICLLLSRSLDVEKVVEFVNVLEAGCLGHQKDSIAYKNDLIRVARSTPLIGLFGEIVDLALQVFYLQKSLAKLSLGEKNMNSVINLLSTKTTLRLGEKALLSRLSRSLAAR